MDLTNVYTILGIILIAIVLLSILSWIWNKFTGSNINSEVQMTGGNRPWKRAMRKLRK